MKKDNQKVLFLLQKVIFMKKLFSFSFENLNFEIFKIQFSFDFRFDINKKK